MNNQKSIDSVCEYRGVPAIKKGQPCEVDGKRGLIIGGNSSSNFNVRFAGRKDFSNCHPDYKMVIRSMDLKNVIHNSSDG